MNDDVTEPRCQSFAYNNGEVQCEREWGHSVCGPDPINWHRNGGFSWNTPTHSGPYTFILADPPAPPARGWLVPADTMETLSRMIGLMDANTAYTDFRYLGKIVYAARAVLDAATEVER